MTQRPPSLGLARFVNIPGGTTFDQAQQRADLRLEFIKPKALADIDALIASMGQLI
ncbi:MAG: hypothetical protein HY054_16075 [Proteobacteria bacterium]|nr:hypothetical protein [Pseudomonadota bacterium]